MSPEPEESDAKVPRPRAQVLERLKPQFGIDDLGIRAQLIESHIAALGSFSVTAVAIRLQDRLDVFMKRLDAEIVL